MRMLRTEPWEALKRGGQSRLQRSCETWNSQAKVASGKPSVNYAIEEN